MAERTGPGSSPNLTICMGPVGVGLQPMKNWLRDENSPTVYILIYIPKHRAAARWLLPCGRETPQSAMKASGQVALGRVRRLQNTHEKTTRTTVPYQRNYQHFQTAINGDPGESWQMHAARRACASAAFFQPAEAIHKEYQQIGNLCVERMTSRPGARNLPPIFPEPSRGGAGGAGGAGRAGPTETNHFTSLSRTRC